MLSQMYAFYEELQNDGVVVCFSGPTTQGVVEGIGQVLKQRLEFENAEMTTIQRVFSIFVEQVQNIANYSVEQTPSDAEEGAKLRHGVVVVGRSGDKFYVICGNKVRQEQSRRMMEQISYLRQLDKEGLKDLYKRTRREEKERAGSKGAGLGFIEMFRRAREPLECHVSAIDDDTVFFTVKAIG